MSSKKKFPVALTAIVSAGSILTVALNIVLMLFEPIITQYLDSSSNDILAGAAYTSDYESQEEMNQASLALIEEIEADGVVLLKNDNGLPLSTSASAKTKVSLLGRTSVDLIYGGSGSGGILGDYLNLKTAMESANFEINPTLWDYYLNCGLTRGTAVDTDGNMTFEIGEPSVASFSDEVNTSLQEYNDVALVTIGRIGGEGRDLPWTAEEMSTWDSSMNHYLELSATERDLLTMANDNFDNVVVLINANNPMELDFLEDPAYPNIKAALWIGGPGLNGINSVAKILSGEVNPSGRLVDTYAYDATSAASYANFGIFTYDNVEYSYANNFAEYEEGIYVGYKYYETLYAGSDNEFDNAEESAYQKAVQYPFGYGLSYSSFDKTIGEVKIDDHVVDTSSPIIVSAEDEIAITVQVENTGDVAGKEAVQLYYTAPYTVNGIEKASINLLGYGKTNTLASDAKEEVQIQFSVRDFASYDYDDANANGFGGYEIEKGDYLVKLMNNAHEEIQRLTFQVSEDIRLETSENGATVENRFGYAQGENTSYLSRADFVTTAPSAPTNFTASQTVLDGLAITYEDDPAAVKPTMGQENGLTLADMAQVDYDDEKWDLLLDQLTANEMSNLVGRAGWRSEAVASVGKEASRDMDGPSGLTYFLNKEVHGNAYPSPCLLASTFDPALAERYGKIIGEEALYLGVTGWYGPACNIHRSPFSGRNFEYFSEDAILSGKMSAAVVKGAKSKGLLTFLKHFAVNDFENERRGISVWIDEQSLREIYLKPFEIAVKEGGTLGLMSAFSRIGTSWTGGNYQLLTEVLRNEWGFHGAVITDWAGTYDFMNQEIAIRGGGDMMLTTVYLGPYDKNPDVDNTTSLVQMRRACHNILYAYSRSNLVNVTTSASHGLPTWIIILIVVDCVIGLALATGAVFIVKKVRKKAE